MANGRVEHIHVTSGAGAPMRSLTRVRAIAGVGLEGDRYAMGVGHYSKTPATGRHLTLIEAEQLEWLMNDQLIELKPAEARRNLTTRGIRLNPLVGKQFWIGAVLCKGMRLCEPCDYLDKLTGKIMLKPLVKRAGLRAEILTDGEIAVGDEIRSD